MTKTASFVETTWRHLFIKFGPSSSTGLICPSWIQLTNYSGSLYAFWRKCRRKVAKNQRRDMDGLLIYFWWNLWKERNGRIFQQQELNPRQVLPCAKMRLCSIARLAMASSVQVPRAD